MSLRSVLVAPLGLSLSAVLVAGAVVASGDPVPIPATTPLAELAPAAAKKPVSCSVGSGVTAKQVVVVRATGAKATVKACRRVSGGKYVVALGPYSGHVGRNGVAAKGKKREGDGKTPYGTYKLRGGFGVKKNPGVTFRYFKADSRDRWVDDSSSKYYNLHKRAPANGRWKSAERLKVSPAYDYAQVIGYNEARKKGRGSAIFFHVDQGKGTAGCVSIPRASLLKILRWEKPGAVMSIKKAAKRKTVATTTVAASSLAAKPIAVPAAYQAPAYKSSVRKAKKSDVKYSWHKGCPVGVKSLRVITVRYWGFDERAHTGSLVVNKSVATDLRTAFRKMYEMRFAIRKIRTIDKYKGSDNKSMAADNTSAFNCRKAVSDGPSSWSNHAYGVAVDLNPRENPYILNGKVLPKAGEKYTNRKAKKKGLIHSGGKVVKAFRALGFRWGGVWSDPDYQHFDRR